MLWKWTREERILGGIDIPGKRVVFEENIGLEKEKFR